MNSAAISDFRIHLGELFRSALATVAPGVPIAEITLERPKQTQHGDYACNIALQLAKTLKRKPRDIAAEVRPSVVASLAQPKK